MLFMDNNKAGSYLKEFKAFSKKITSTEKSTREFLVRAGINTPTGKLTRNYSE